MNKKDFWPKEGKLKKALLIIVIIAVAVLIITLVEEKTNIRFSSRISFVIALTCIGVWVYNPAKKNQ